jgi:hypothetical protein
VCGGPGVKRRLRSNTTQYIPGALVVPFEGTESFSARAHVGRLVNLTQRKYAYMRPRFGFHSSLANVNVSDDPSIDHISID